MDPEAPRDDDRARPSAPPSLHVAAVLVAVQGLAIAVLGLLEAVHTSSSRVVMGASTALFFVVLGTALLGCAWGLRRVSTWARGPVLIAQLISLGMAWSFRGSDTWGISMVLAVPAVAVLGAMLHPATLAALDERG